MHVLRTALTYPREAIGTALVGAATLLAVVGLTIGPSSPLTGSAGANVAPPSAKPRLPAPEPLQFKNVSREDAQTINAVMPFSADPNPAARALTVKFPDRMNEARALDCLTAAVYYEAAIEPPDGQRAVAQVVLNRLRHPAYPKTVCGVVFQGSDRRTGCQFTFTCDGALARAPNMALWNRAREIAWAALSGRVFAPVGWSTHYHTDWVVPYWASSLAKATKVGTYAGQCAELCGRNHANMTARVRVVPFDEYQAWFDREAADIKVARDEGAKQRAEINKQQSTTRTP